jgi:hypothetical protein
MGNTQPRDTARRANFRDSRYSTGSNLFRSSFDNKENTMTSYSSWTRSFVSGRGKPAHRLRHLTGRVCVLSGEGLETRELTTPTNDTIDFPTPRLEIRTRPVMTTKRAHFTWPLTWPIILAPLVGLFLGLPWDIVGAYICGSIATGATIALGAWAEGVNTRVDGIPLRQALRQPRILPAMRYPSAS